MRLGRQERPTAVRKEDQVLVAAQIKRATVALVEGGLTVYWSRLDGDEQADLVALTRAGLTADGKGGFSPDGLGRKEAAKWERLVEQASNSPEIFASFREQAKFDHDIRVLAKRAAKPDRRPTYEEEGSVTIPRLAFAWLTRTPPAMTLTEVALLWFICAQLENMQVVSPHGRIEGSGDEATLILSKTYGLGRTYDPFGRLASWKEELGRLHANGWLSVETVGPEFRVQRGHRVLKVTKGRKA